MPAVTYKTIINNAIKGFNDIQDKLATIHAKYGNPLTEVPASNQNNSNKTPLSISNILSSDAFTSAEIDLGNYSQTTVITTSIKSTATNNITLSESSTSFSITVGKDAVITNGEVTPSYTVKSTGYLASGSSLPFLDDQNNSKKITLTQSNITQKVLYLKAGTLGVSNGTASSASATPDAAVTDASHLPYLKDVSNSGITTVAPIGTPSQDYWQIVPVVSTTTNGSVSAPTASVGSEGYIKSGITSSAIGSAVSVSVTKNNAATTYYVGRLSSGTFTVNSNATTNITVGSLTNGFYPLTANITGYWNASKGGYLPVNGSVGGTASNITVGRIQPATITGSIGSPTTVGFNESSSATEWYVSVVPNTKVTIAGYAPLNTAGTNGAASRVYIPGAEVQNGFVTAGGMVAVDDEIYLTRYNSADDCVEIYFNPNTIQGSSDLTDLLDAYY